MRKCFKFVFQKPSTPGLSTIRRIETVDAAKKPSIFEILEGGIGSKSATIAVTSQEGGEIDSTFRFYGDETESSGNEGSTSDPNATPSATSAEQPTPMPTLSPEYISQEEAELNSMAERMFSKFDVSETIFFEGFNSYSIFRSSGSRKIRGSSGLNIFDF